MRYGTTMIVGLSGYGNVGKDEVGRILVEKHGFTKRAVNLELLKILTTMNPYLMADEYYPEKRAADIIADRGYEWAKANTDARELMQRLADALRSYFGDSCLVDIVLANPEGDIVLTSTREWDEAERIEEAGGHMWRIERPGTGPVNDHATETALDEYAFECVIVNDGSLSDLEDAVAGALEHARRIEAGSIRS